MKILHVINGVEVGGAESLLASLLEEWTDDHHVVVLQTPGPLSDRIRRAARSVTYLGASKSTFDFGRMVIGLNKAAAQIAPDIVHSHLVQSDLVSLASRVGKAKRVTSIHVASLQPSDPMRSRFVARLVGALSSRFAVAIATSRRAHEHMLDMGYSCQSLIVNNGTPRAQNVYSESGDVVFLSLARFHPVKDHGTLLRAFDQHHRSFPASRLICAGLGVSLENPDFRALAESVLGDALDELPVSFVGPSSDVGSLFSGSSALVISSLSETFPLVGAEACMAGIPVITTDVGDAREFAMVPSFVVESGSADDLAGAMNRFAALTPAERMELSNSSHSRGVERFDIAVTARSYTEAYEDLIDGGH